MSDKNEGVSFIKLVPTSADSTGLSMDVDELLRSSGFIFPDPDSGGDDPNLLGTYADKSRKLRWPKITIDSGYGFLKQPEKLVLRKSELDDEVSQLRKEIEGKARELSSKSTALAAQQTEIADLKQKLARFDEIQKLNHLLTRVGPAGQQRLLESPDFRKEFARDTPADSYVLSIDIRRSTELMLKAREPKLYARFVLELAIKLRKTVLENFGVFDKFTGDGVLAFFPEFYAGRDAGLWAVRAALVCHAVFREHYDANRSSFHTVLRDIGLGIGLDFGSLAIVEIGGDLTVVGTPVVYACRMGGAPAGTTLVNHPAYERLFERHAEYCDFRETELDVKHEGKILAYAVTGSGKPLRANQPEWAADAPTEGVSP
jgi:adenylate cyclase